MTSWQDHARCVGQNTDAFYPDRSRPDFKGQITDAKEYCKGFGDPCPVIHECLMYALERADSHGIWGGLSNRERRALFRKKTLPSWITREDLDKIEALHEQREDEFRLEGFLGREEEADVFAWTSGTTLVVEDYLFDEEDGCAPSVRDVFRLVHPSVMVLAEWV